MTNTVDTSAAWGRPEERSGGADASQPVHAVVEQATGALIFRYSIGSEAAASLMELWAAEAGVPPERVARAIVLDICQGLPDTGSDPGLVRWLEDRLRQEVSLDTLHEPPATAAQEHDPAEPEPGEPAPETVVVAVDQSDVSLDAVVQATRQAARLGVPLRITLDRSAYLHGEDEARDHLSRRVDLAVELARALEPGVEVLRPGDDDTE